MFAEADADLTADDFGDVKCPPFPCFERFILESTTVAGVEPVVDRPLLYVQVLTSNGSAVSCWLAVHVVSRINAY
jgi:hypothetical protein